MAIRDVYKDKTEFDGLNLYHWVFKDVKGEGDPLDVAIHEFSQAFDYVGNLLDIWLATGLITKDELITLLEVNNEYFRVQSG